MLYKQLATDLFNPLVPKAHNSECLKYLKYKIYLYNI